MSHYTGTGHAYVWKYVHEERMHWRHIIIIMVIIEWGCFLPVLNLEEIECKQFDDTE
jgi:hypothetical protein